MSAQIVLASASPRRCELLNQIGVRFEQQSAEVNETPRTKESAEEYVSRLALDKARAIWKCRGYQGIAVLGADTSVVMDEQLFAKPQDFEDCRRMLRSLSGRKHQVLTAVALVREREAIRVSVSDVWFRRISDSEIDAYWRSGEPVDKAGSYAIQGIAGIFIKRLEGSYSGVMGLPLLETAQLLTEFEIEILERTL